MLKRIIVCIGCAIGLMLGAQAGIAAGLPVETFNYTQDFEKSDPVMFWVCRIGQKSYWNTNEGKENYTVNFKGLTEEKKLNGKSSFKLDFTFNSDALVAWQIPMPRMVPAEGKLKLTGNIYVGGETTNTGGISIGAAQNYPPHSVTGACWYYYHPAGKDTWLPIEYNVVENAGKFRMTAFDWGESDVTNGGSYLRCLDINFRGKKGDRVVIYLDDINVNGEVPLASAYEVEIQKRYAPIKEKVENKIRTWETTLKQREDELNGINPTTDSVKDMKKAAMDKITELKAALAKIIARGKRSNLLLREVRSMDDGLAVLENTGNNIKNISQGGVKSGTLLVSTVSPISGIPVLPSSGDIYGTLNTAILAVAAPGEYEPASFVVHALSDISALEVKTSDLKKKEAGTIPASSIDIKIVKCWYQAGTAWYDINQDKQKRVLVPELLLNDDSLVRVVDATKDNYLKLSFPSGKRYIWISDPDEGLAERKGSKSPESTVIPCEEFPVKDSPVLLPVDIPAQSNKQFWITIKVPDDASAGVYTGSISLYEKKTLLSTLELKLRVLPFKLAQPYCISSMYYAGGPYSANGAISAYYKSESQVKNELQNMRAHGVTNPILTHYSDDLSKFERALEIRAELGMTGQPLFFQGKYNMGYDISTPVTPDKLDLLKKKVRAVIDITKKFNIPEVYFYGIDEARGEMVTAQKPVWQAIHEAGGKVFVAGYPGQFELAGDVLDLLISRSDKQETALWHSAGKKVGCYGLPQSGLENPEVYRRNYGLLLWKREFDMACDFAYHWSFYNIWNDFDHLQYRDHNFVYPTADGVIDTIAWEGYREGLDDIRYLTTLTQTIKEAKKSRDKRMQQMVAAAEAYINELKQDVETRNPDSVRLEIIDHILKLRG